MITNKTRQYWLDTLRGWAEDRLSLPQFQECCAALNGVGATSTDDELPPEGKDILWWYPCGGGKGWRRGEYYSPALWSSRSCWYLGDGPTWWMFPPPDPTEEANDVSEV